MKIFQVNTLSVTVFDYAMARWPEKKQGNYEAFSKGRE